MIAGAAPRAAAAEGATRIDWTAFAGGGAVALALAAVAARNGGYFPTAWGWSALVFAWCTLLAAVLGREPALDALTLTFLAGVAALAGWICLSAAWSVSPGVSIEEGERALVYAAAVATLVLVVRRLGAAAVCAGMLVAATGISAYALATRLFPGRIGTYDPIATYRLASPVGYWNALGLFAAIGSLLALGFVARGRRGTTRALANASLIVLVPTLYFTFSRGACLALAIALAFVVVLDPCRLQACAALLVAAPAAALGVVLASRDDALTTQGAKVALATKQGRDLGLELAALVVVAAALGAGFALAARRSSPPRALRAGFAGLLVVALLAGGAAATARWGAPWHVAQRSWHSFTSPPPKTGKNLNDRLFQLSNNNRIVSWKSALREWEHAPLAGTGAGTFESWWLEHRPQPQQIRDAHSLYLETLGELGIVGLALLALVVLVPLAAAIRARRQPLVPFAAAAFLAWAVHAGVDWDWEVPAVTLPALACAVICCAGATRGELRLGAKGRALIGTLAAAIATFGLVAAIGNQALASSQDALDGQNYAQAETDALKASRWAPWLADPWIIRGEISALNEADATARADFRAAIRKDPRSYLAWYGLAGVERGAAHRRAVARVVGLNPLSDEAAELTGTSG